MILQDEAMKMLTTDQEMSIARKDIGELDSKNPS